MSTRWTRIDLWAVFCIIVVGLNTSAMWFTETTTFEHCALISLSIIVAGQVFALFKGED